MIGTMELISLLAGFCVFLVGIPAAVSTYSIGGKWYWRASAAFVLTCAFLMVTTMFTGFLHASFPGIVIALWAFWIMGLLVWSDGKGLADLRPRLQKSFLTLL